MKKTLQFLCSFKRSKRLLPPRQCLFMSFADLLIYLFIFNIIYCMTQPLSWTRCCYCLLETVKPSRSPLIFSHRRHAANVRRAESFPTGRPPLPPLLSWSSSEFSELWKASLFSRRPPEGASSLAVLLEALAGAALLWCISCLPLFAGPNASGSSCICRD